MKMDVLRCKSEYEINASTGNLIEAKDVQGNPTGASGPGGAGDSVAMATSMTRRIR